MPSQNPARRKFLRNSSLAAASAIAFPFIVPASVMGPYSPSNQINVGMIGTGRQALQVNLRNGFLKLQNCRVLATNDVDRWRMNLATAEIKKSGHGGSSSGREVREYEDYRDLIADKDVDAVMVSTPDHWHAPATIAAALAGKHISMEKAFTLAPAWGSAVVGAVNKVGVTGRLDSEFRSLRPFNQAVELVHNGVIGNITHVEVGVPGELNGSAIAPQATMSVPKELNYDMWLGPAFPTPYTLHRVHDPQKIDTRPGWLRISDYCNGMITNWGAHLNDIALWGIRKELEAPISVEGTGLFDQGLWNTINSFDLRYEYEDGTILNYMIDVPYVKFYGDRGWVRVEYPDKLTSSKQEILDFEPGAGDVSYKNTRTDKADFLHGIETGQPTMEDLDVGYNVYFLTFMGLLSVKLGRKLNWDAGAGQFINDNAANAMLTHPFREKWLDNNVIDWMNRYQEIKLD